MLRSVTTNSEGVSFTTVGVSTARIEEVSMMESPFNNVEGLMEVSLSMKYCSDNKGGKSSSEYSFVPFHLSIIA